MIPVLTSLILLSVFFFLFLICCWFVNRIMTNGFQKLVYQLFSFAFFIAANWRKMWDNQIKLFTLYFKLRLKVSGTVLIVNVCNFNFFIYRQSPIFSLVTNTQLSSLNANIDLFYPFQTPCHHSVSNQIESD